MRAQCSKMAKGRYARVAASAKVSPASNQQCKVNMDQGTPGALAGRHILLGITGGIAAYKTPDLVRKLRAAGAEVCVVTTAGAQQFVSTTALQAVSGRAVRNSLWDEAAEAAMGHIELARWADTVLIAPATANSIAKLAHGQADDLLTTLCLATTAALAVAPAMNVRMWQHPATQSNIATLKGRGNHLLGPAEGEQACGEFGPGRLLEPTDICTALAAIPPGQSIQRPLNANNMAANATNSGVGRPDPLTTALAGINVLITAGPTREPIDPVRYISNRSSGKQGYALAAEAASMGATVTLVSGPTALPIPPGVKRIDVLSAKDMLAAVSSHLDQTQLFIGVAAVADYRVADVAAEKIKKTSATQDGITLELVTNPDIIATVAAKQDGPITVGFAAETHQGLTHARSKLERKGLDLIALNDVSDQRIGFSSNENALTILWADGEEQVPMQDKSAIARSLLGKVIELFQSRLSGYSPTP